MVLRSRALHARKELRYNHLLLSYTAVHIYTFLKGCKGAKTKEEKADNILETLYFGDIEESSDSDKERTEGKTFIHKLMYLVRLLLDNIRTTIR